MYLFILNVIMYVLFFHLLIMMNLGVLLAKVSMIELKPSEMTEVGDGLT